MSPTLEDRLRATMRAHVPTEPPTDEQWEEITAAGDRARAHQRRTRTTTTVIALVGAAALIVAALVVVRTRDAEQGRRLDTAAPGEVAAGTALAPGTVPGAELAAAATAALDLAHALEDESIVPQTVLTVPDAGQTAATAAQQRAATDRAATRLRAALGAPALSSLPGLGRYRATVEQRLSQVPVVRQAFDARQPVEVTTTLTQIAADVAGIGWVLIEGAPSGDAAVDLAVVTSLATDTARRTAGSPLTENAALGLATPDQRAGIEALAARGTGASFTDWQHLESALLDRIDWTPAASATPATDSSLGQIGRSAAALQAGLATRAVGGTTDEDVARRALEWRKLVDMSGLADRSPAMRRAFEDASSMVTDLAAHAPVETMASVYAVDRLLARFATTGSVARRLLAADGASLHLSATTGLAVTVIEHWNDLTEAFGPSEGGAPATVSGWSREQGATLFELTAPEGRTDALRRAQQVAGFDAAAQQVEVAARTGTPPSLTLEEFRAAALAGIEGDRSVIDEILP